MACCFDDKEEQEACADWDVNVDCRYSSDASISRCVRRAHRLLKSNVRIVLTSSLSRMAYFL